MLIVAQDRFCFAVGVVGIVYYCQCVCSRFEVDGVTTGRVERRVEGSK